MKRRFLALALVLSAALALCACGDNADSQQDVAILQPNVQEGLEKLASVKNCHLVLQLTINPQLELYLDEAGTVLKAAAGNEDGEVLLAELDLTGLAYSDAVSAILSGAEEQGLLAENARVQIDVLASADGPLAYEETRQLEQAVTDYSEDLSASIDQSTVVAAQCGAALIEIENAENGDVWYSYYSSDVTLIREICYGADGSYREWVYLDGSTTTDAIDIAPDGSRQEEHMTYYSDGTQKTHEVIGTDGTSSWEAFTEYYENGNPKTSKEVWADGSVAESTFYTNGSCKTSKEVRADGTVQERTYYENGQRSFYKDVYPDGTVRERSYDENGNLKTSKDVWADGTTAEEHCTYYSGGTRKTWKMVRTDGTALEEYFEEYYENGNQKTYNMVRSDGTVAEQRFAENGNLIYRFESGDNHKMEEHYDENGNLSYRFESNGDRSVETHYYADGRPKTEEEHCPNGEFYVYRYTSYGEDGSQHIIEKAPDGTTYEHFYDANGNRIEN